jgi:fluoroacetyl-CoA thioesterase
MNKEDLEKIKPGMEASVERIVTQELTLKRVNSEWPAVFSTPAMIGMMELASSLAVRPALPPGTITVGVRIEVDHIKALPAGETVIATSKLVEINGSRLTFEVEARNGSVVIGRGRVFQSIVDHSRFNAIAAGKSTSS